MELEADPEKTLRNDIQDRDRQLILLYNECVEFVDCCNSSADPAVQVVKRMAGSIQNEVYKIRKTMLEDSDVQLGPEYYDIDPGVPLYDELPGGFWWEGVNILNIFSTSLHVRLLDLRPPADPVAFAEYIRSLIKEHLIYHGRCPGRWIEYDMPEYFHYSKMLRRACEEIQRVYNNTPGGPILALDLYLELKVNILQFSAATVLDWAQTDCHTYVSKMISRTLKSPILHQAFPPPTFTRYCRMVRERMHRLNCVWGKSGEYSEWILADTYCVHDMLVPDLDLFQRYAYFEVRDNVHLAVAKRLPAELVMLVFELTMDAEGLTLDPRILVDAYCAEPTPTTALKSRLECSHLARCPRERGKLSGYGRTEPDDYGPEYVVGPEWKEVFPHFPHSQIRDMNDMIAMDIYCSKACAVFGDQAGWAEASLHSKSSGKESLWDIQALT